MAARRRAEAHVNRHASSARGALKMALVRHGERGVARLLRRGDIAPRRLNNHVGAQA